MSVGARKRRTTNIKVASEVVDKFKESYYLDSTINKSSDSVKYAGM